MIEVKKDYYSNGNIYCESYYINGERHREDGPAFVSYDYDTGSIVEVEVYYINGKHHREDGPAVIYYDEDGNIEYKEYWLNDEELTEQEWFNQLSIESKLKIAFGLKND
jgi:antitoxin component YwqK of YwqJK toxin-antitoxin module